ncbi:MAG: hypothetical protein Q8L10_05325 [Candidatus Moranbacteria bacterium]|nr:hypothetical protein [Candidatus Moranbacteria bacterium]
MSKTKLLLIFTLAIFGTAFFVVSAKRVSAESLPIEQPEDQSDIEANEHPEDEVGCFKYYKFQSVKIDVGTSTDKYYVGEYVTFDGSLINENNYPVVDGNIFVRIGKYNEKRQTEGDYTVDEFFALEDVRLDANEEKIVSFRWKVPAWVSAGDYTADFFYSVGKKFNLGGLPFTNEVVINSLKFSVDTNDANEADVYFNKSETEVDGKKYNHIGNWPVVKMGDPVNITQPLSNTFNIEKTAKVTYDLFYWDSLDEKDKLDSRTEEINIPAKSKVNLAYTLSNVERTVYYLRITSISDEQKSIANIRLTSDGFSPRLNYPAITEFPLKKGDKATVFSCFHNTAASENGGNVSVKLFDKDGNQIDEVAYSGIISGSMAVASKEIYAKSDYNYLRLKAEVRNTQGQVIDSYENEYDCQKINSKKCQAPAATIDAIESQKAGQDTNLINEKIIAIMIVLVFILLIIIMVIFIRRRKSHLGIFLFFVVSGTLFFGKNIFAYYEKTYMVTRACNLHHTAPVPDIDWTLTSSFSRQVGITSIMKNSSGKFSVAINDPINFTYSESATYNATGSTSDSPNAFLCNEKMKSSGGWPVNNFRNTNPMIDPNFDCHGGDWINTGGQARPITASWRKASVSMVSSDSKIISCSGMNCVAKSPGTAIISAKMGPAYNVNWYSDRYGNFWSYGHSAPAVPEKSRKKWTITVAKPIYKDLTLVKSGPGSVTFSQSKTADPCNVGDCRRRLPNNQQSVNLTYLQDADVELTAHPGVGSDKAIWKGCVPDALDGNICRVKMGNSKNVKITFSIPAPALTFSASPSAITSGSPSTLTWTTSNAASCWAQNPASWRGWKVSTNGSHTQTVFPTATTTYDLKCWNSAGIFSGEETVTVSVASPAPANPCASIDPIAGRCGVADGQAYLTAPASNLLCSSGNPSPASLSGSGPWNWTCNGICSTSNASCSASQSVDLNWKEVNPN